MGDGAGALGTLRFVMIGGGVLDAGTQALVKQAAPNAQVLQFYGAAETSFITLSDQDTPMGSVGRAFPDVQIDVRNIDPSDGQGDVWVTSPYLFDDYTSGAGATTWRDSGWICVGERGFLDKNGYLFLTGRRSRMFLAGDKNIHPEEIEACIMDCAGVISCAVLGRSDALRGNRICAMVCAFDPMLATTVLAHLNKHLPRYMIPSQIDIISPDNWPVLASGKPDLAKLKDRL
jgi:long-chain acyl-CoA synthetase